MLDLKVKGLKRHEYLLWKWCRRQLVSTYKGKFGYVHYYVKALLERPQQPALECKKSFDVEEPLDVNTPDLLVSLDPSHRHITHVSAFHMQSPWRLTVSVPSVSDRWNEGEEGHLHVHPRWPSVTQCKDRPQWLL